MATWTENLHLKRPTQMDFYNVADLNENFDKIDAAFGALNPKVHIKSVVLYKGDWNDYYQQTVNCDGIAENELTQCVLAVPIPSHSAMFNSVKAKITKQRAGKLTFTAGITPTTDMVVRIIIFTL